MSKRAEQKALEAYPYNRAYTDNDVEYDGNFCNRLPYIEGYEQAEKDIISHIREQIERWMPKDNGEEHIKGERTAFNSVLHLLKEIEEE